MIFIIVFTSLVLDQLSKFIVTKTLFLNKPVVVMDGVFNLTLIHNKGAAFGILKNQTVFLIFTSLFAVALIYFSLRKNSHQKHYIISLSLILAGAIGNLIDRLFLGYVIDFLDFRVWPVFNFADTSITIGAFILGWFIIFKKDESANL